MTHLALERLRDIAKVQRPKISILNALKSLQFLTALVYNDTISVNIYDKVSNEKETIYITGRSGFRRNHFCYFQDAGMDVDIASIKGGAIPIDPMSYKFMIITDADKRSRKDDAFQSKVTQSLKIDNVDFTQYDAIFLAGGWGAAYDLGQSDILAEKISEAYYDSDAVIGGVCHGPLGLVRAKDKDGNLLIAGRKMSGVTDKQIDELKINFTPLHPESALRAAGAKFEASTAKKDLFATHTVVDDEGRFVTGQNQNSGHVTAHEMMRLVAER